MRLAQLLKNSQVPASEGIDDSVKTLSGKELILYRMRSLGWRSTGKPIEAKKFEPSFSRGYLS